MKILLESNIAILTQDWYSHMLFCLKDTAFTTTTWNGNYNMQIANPLQPLSLMFMELAKKASDVEIMAAYRFSRDLRQRYRAFRCSQHVNQSSLQKL